MSRFTRRALMLVSVTPALSAAHAHDFFLLADPRPGGGPPAISATVGSAFPTPEIVVTEDRIASLSAKTATSAPQVAVVGINAKSSELKLATAPSSPMVVGVALKPRDVEYGEDRIDLILGEYQVSDAAKAAVASLPRPRTLKADSRRFAKAIVCAASCEGVAAVPPHGFELEFVPLSVDRFRLLQRGEAVADYPVTIAGADGKRHEHRTDVNGAVALPSHFKGPTMLFASTMTVPAVPGARFVMRLTSLSMTR